MPHPWPLHWLPQAHVCQDSPEDAPDDRFKAAEMRDLVAMERGAVISRPVAAQAPGPHPDSELLETCAVFDRLEHAYVAVGGNHAPGSPEEDASELERERISTLQEPLVARMVALRTVTREGMAARARSLALWDAELMKDGTGDTGQCLTYAIVRDLLAGRIHA